MSGLLERAEKVLPGGVNSPVRAFRGVGGSPVFVRAAEGAWLEGEDGRRYIDYIGGYGPHILGHRHPAIVEAIQEALGRGTAFGAPTLAEVEIAETIVAALPAVDMVRLVNSGTEATMSALRLARAATGRNRFLKFEGCYHGHADPFLIAAGSGAATIGVPSSPGVPQAVVADTLLAPYNDLDAVEEVFEREGDAVAAVIVEPIAGNMNLVPPAPGFLQGLRALCDRHGSLLIFDEVMTGFRVSWGGAQSLFDLRPDLSTFGKVIGGGLLRAARADEPHRPGGPGVPGGHALGQPAGRGRRPRRPARAGPRRGLPLRPAGTDGRPPPGGDRGGRPAPRHPGAHPAPGLDDGPLLHVRSRDHAGGRPRHGPGALHARLPPAAGARRPPSPLAL
jgi:glutamate-1-semialdehyde 2,1-aminomutase